MKYRFVNEHRHEYGVQSMCRVLKISRAGFYKWLHKPLSDRAIEDLRLLELIRQSYQASNGVYGAPRIHLDLKEVGESCGMNRVAKIMKKHKIKAVLGYKAHRNPAGRPSVVAPNTLNREFNVDEPNTVWVTDITYIRTWQGWLYLAAVMDLYSRRIVGWSMKPSMGKEIVVDALCMAVNRRQPTQRVLVHCKRKFTDVFIFVCPAAMITADSNKRGNHDSSHHHKTPAVLA